MKNVPLRCSAPADPGGEAALACPRADLAFNAHVAAWMRYAESFSGRLNRAIILHHLRPYLPRRARLLDLGCSTGELAAELAREGHAVTLLDFSQAMIDEAAKRCAGLDVQLVRADARSIDRLFAEDSFDGVLCHTMIEFIQDPLELCDRFGGVLRHDGLCSIVFSNRPPALPAPLLAAPAAAAGDSRGRDLDLFGLPWQAFDPETVREMLQANGLCVRAEYGVRVFSDLIGDASDLWEQVFALELNAGARMPYRHMARFIHLIAEKK